MSLYHALGDTRLVCYSKFCTIAWLFWVKGKGKGKKIRGKKKGEEKKRKKRGRNFQLGWGSSRGGKFNLEVFNRVTPYQEMFYPSEN